MGSILYDFLANSFLFDDSRIATSYSDVTDEQLQHETAEYLSFSRTHADELYKEITTNQSNLVVLSDGPLSAVNLCQAALYVNQYLFEDPLLQASIRASKPATAINQYLGLKEKSGLDRGRLARAARSMKDVTPLVAANFVKFLPPSSDAEPSDSLPLRYSEVAFDDVLPAEILRLFREAATVKSMRRVPQGFAVERTLYPCRIIDIEFKGQERKNDFMYMLFEQAISHIDEQDGTFTGQLALSETVPESNYFKHWVRQSVNQASAAMFNQTQELLLNAARLNAVVGSQSELLFKAIRTVYQPKSSVPMRTANAFLNLDLPFVAGLDYDRIAKLRMEEGEAFHRFRLLLDQKLGNMRSVPGSEEAKKEAEAAVHELTEVRMTELDDKLKSVKDKLILNATLSTIGFVAAVQTAGISLLATAVAGVGTAKTWADYRQDVKRNPAFFLWKAMKK
jgi:hypothetical protein